MKFFWKIFFTTMFISVTCLAICGYIIINYNFNSLLDNEIQSSYDFLDVVYYSLLNELGTNKEFFGEHNTGSKGDEISQVAQSININSMTQKISFCILDENRNIIFTSLLDNLDKDLISNLGENQKGWTIKKTNNDTHVQTIRPAVFFGEKYYIERIQNVTSVFTSQKDQYTMLLNIIIIMLGAAGVITFFISNFLMRNIVSLTNATMNISVGNFNNRVDISGNDEFAILSENFNHMADELEEKIYELENESERKDLFVGNFSHELKTPLTSIIGYADMLRRKEMDRERVQFCAEYIFTEGKRLETLSMRLLDLIVLKNQQLNLSSTSILHMFDDICIAIRPQLRGLGIELICNIQDAQILLEPELMKTVFINLIDNARKAIDNNLGGKITITGSYKGNCYKVFICDNGKGMEAKELYKIKEAFYMVDKSRTRKQGGAGLGLSICDQILKLHNFDISFESEVDVGTTVIVAMKGGSHE